MPVEPLNAWEKYVAESFRLRLERDTEIRHIRECWLRYRDQTLLLENLVKNADNTPSF